MTVFRGLHYLRKKFIVFLLIHPPLLGLGCEGFFFRNRKPCTACSHAIHAARGAISFFIYLFNYLKYVNWLVRERYVMEYKERYRNLKWEQQQ